MKHFLFTLIVCITFSQVQAQDELFAKRVGNFDNYELQTNSVWYERAPSSVQTSKKMTLYEFQDDFTPLYLDLDSIIWDSKPTICFPVKYPAIIDTSFYQYNHSKYLKISLGSYLKDPAKVWSKEYQKIATQLESSKAENFRLKLYIGLAFVLNLLLGVWLFRRFTNPK
ncbi:MAG TPA: hypothetical protein DCS93_00320 [Microscillaceae bacterium]|nr:hypothetical protein [Microscillaceae bacterium]